MTKKTILMSSIKKLKENNARILSNLKNIKDKNKIDSLNKVITKNNSLILDYEFQLNQTN
jgi:hypothetical protein